MTVICLFAEATDSIGTQIGKVIKAFCYGEE